ncbi:EAL domain-containing protein [Candidatus Bipolaricaulota bacterium]|nr:EAL domain-containing protein [Candidatus Bipolaricaulota bacterium]
MQEIFEKVDVTPSMALNKTNESILVVNRKGKIVFANDVAKKEISKNGNKLIGTYIHSNLYQEPDSGGESWRECPLRRSITHAEGIRITEGAFWQENGIRIPVELSAKPFENEEGEALGALVSLKDVSDKKETCRKLRHFRNRDQLTGLLNHLKFREKLESYLDNSSGAVLILDIDRFKEVNNSFGLNVADKLLVSLSELLKDLLSGSDVLARFAGDEFIVLSPDRTGDEAEDLVTEIMQAVRNHGFSADGTDLQATVSIGYTLFPEQGDTVNELLAEADIALTQAKKLGRNQFKVYDSDQDSQDEVKSRVGWVNQINNAIKENNFVLYAQPILELGSDNISHYEILIRMLEGEGKLISPGRFLPVAEKFGLSRDIDKWVVNETLRSLPKSTNGKFNNQFAINLSGQSLTDNELLNWLKCNQSLDSDSFERILFEVTETAALSNIQSANNFITALKSRGSKFALDDFGMGFSSFNYLKQLSVDYLKIDGSFIQNLPRNSMNQDLVQSIVEVAHRLKKETIAEFVEDEETLEMVRNYGTDHAQGYHIGRPQPLQSLL